MGLPRKTFGAGFSEGGMLGAPLAGVRRTPHVAHTQNTVCKTKGIGSRWRRLAVRVHVP